MKVAFRKKIYRTEIQVFQVLKTREVLSQNNCLLNKTKNHVLKGKKRMPINKLNQIL